MKKPCVLSYPLSAQRRLWSDWAYAQADHPPSLIRVFAGRTVTLLILSWGVSYQSHPFTVYFQVKKCKLAWVCQHNEAKSTKTSDLPKANIYTCICMFGALWKSFVSRGGVELGERMRVFFFFSDKMHLTPTYTPTDPSSSWHIPVVQTVLFRFNKSEKLKIGRPTKTKTKQNCLYHNTILDDTQCAIRILCVCTMYQAGTKCFKVKKYAVVSALLKWVFLIDW